MISAPDFSENQKDLQPFVKSMLDSPRYGLHNPFLNKERYLMLGEVSRKASELLKDPEVSEFFIKCM